MILRGIFVFALLTLTSAPAVARPSSVPAPAHSDFADTRLTVTFGDDDLLTDGEDSPASLLPGFGDRADYELPFDNLNTKDTGRESATHLVLYRKMPAFFEDVTVEAALVARLELYNFSSVTIRDTGSYIRVHYAPWEDEEEGLSVIAFPFDSDRVRLGYLYRLSVNGTDQLPRTQWIGAPGVKVQLTVGHGYYYLAFKAAPAMSAPKEVGNEQGTKKTVTVYETQYGGLAGAGWDLFGDRLRLELGAGFFEMGDNPVKGLEEEPYFSFGGAFRAVFHQAMEIQRSIDMMLYTNDLNRPFWAFRPVRYVPGRLGYLVSMEGVVLGQNLADPDRFGMTVIQPALALALQGRLQYGYLRLEVTGLYKDVAFLFNSTPGFIAATALPDQTQSAPQLMASATADYHFPAAHLTLALSAGFVRPAMLNQNLYASAGTGIPTSVSAHKIVIKDNGNTTILPPGKDVGVEVYTRIQARLDIAEMLYLLGWVQLIHDPNLSIIQNNAGLTSSWVAVDSLLLGLGLTAAIRF